MRESSEVRREQKGNKQRHTNREKQKPTLSGREGGSRVRKEGEDYVSAASSAAPSEASASERESPIPGGGSSWFVLLTEEKNERERYFRIQCKTPHKEGFVMQIPVKQRMTMP